MDARIKEKKEPNNFKPFTLEIDVDTLDELKYLWMMFNVGVEYITHENEEYRHSIISETSVSGAKSKVWTTLDDKLEEELNK